MKGERREGREKRLTINCKFAVDFFARGLHTRTAVARLPLRQLGFLVKHVLKVPQNKLTSGHLTVPNSRTTINTM